MTKTYQLQPDYWSHYKRLNFIKKHTLKYQNPRILDLACGTGILVAFPLAELGYEVTGVDIDPRSIAAAMEQNPFPNLSFVCSDFNEYYPDKKFDVVVAAEVMEHLDDPVTLLTGIKRVLAPGGTAIITIPNGYGPHEMEEAIYHRFFEPFNFIPNIRFFNRSITCIKLKLLRHPCEWPKRYPPTEKLEMTVNVECGHKVRITERWFREMCHDTGFDLIERQAGAILHGQITGHTIGNFSPVNTVNMGLADYLPMWMASRWFFALKLPDDSRVV